MVTHDQMKAAFTGKPLVEMREAEIQPMRLPFMNVGQGWLPLNWRAKRPRQASEKKLQSN